MFIQVKRYSLWLCLLGVLGTDYAWAAGEGILWKISKSGVAASYLLAAMLVDHNPRRVERQQCFFRDRCRHPPGEKGLLRLLQNCSYAVTPVY